MLRIGPLLDGLPLKGFNVFNPTTEVDLKLGMDGWRDYLELGFGGFQGSFFEVGVVIAMWFQEEPLGGYGANNCTCRSSGGGILGVGRCTRSYKLV